MREVPSGCGGETRKRLRSRGIARGIEAAGRTLGKLTSDERHTANYTKRWRD